MSDFSRFMKKNQIVKPNTFFPATASLTDEEGKPLQWEIRALTTPEAERIRAANVKWVVDSNGRAKQRISETYTTALVAAAVVVPDLRDAALQDSYGVSTPEDLLMEMVPSPGEYYAFSEFVMKYSGMDTNINSEIEEAKN